jgi:tryptophan-rich sensory protein
MPRHFTAGPLALLGMLALFVAAAFAAAGIGSAVTIPEIPGWYRGLAKPFWTPPDWLFGPVWTLLYLLMGVSAWMAWRNAGWRRGHGLWLLQLGLNALWSLLFFRLHQVGAAAVEILLLWVLILATLRSFRRFSKWAAWLLYPYLLWVAYAATLTWGILLLN